MRKLLPNVFKPLSTSHGQGVIEYILVLIVTVAIILGMIYQFNDAFRVYAKSYFGDYLACLLETGELPSIGGEGGMCNAFFQPFSIANGRPHLEGTTGDGGGGSRNNEGGSAAPTKAGESKPSGNSPYLAKNSGGGGSQVAPRPSFSSGGDSASSSSRSRRNYTGSSEASIPPSALGIKGSDSGSRDQYLEGDFYVERRQVEESEEGTNKIAYKGTSSSVQRAQRMRVNRQDASVKSPEADVEFTVGNFLRILLIIAIIVALVVFLGGQALQISKSMD